ncbi:MAG: transporter substrate-binding domain-containing protein [Chloroflexota bacterium]
MDHFQDRSIRRPISRPSQSVFVALITLVVSSVLLGCNLLPSEDPVIVIASPTPDTTDNTIDTAAEQPTATAEPDDANTDATTDATAEPETTPTNEAIEETIPEQTTESVLQKVRDRGRLICGTNADLPGFGFYDNVRGEWQGFDVDFCRVVAAAVLGDADAVEFVGLTTSGANERFEAIRSGTVDVMFRNTTWTISRDIAGLAFGPTTFHDGQTFMVREDSGIETVEDLAGSTICVAEGTTSELNLNDVFTARGFDFTAQPYPDASLLYPAYDEGECDAVTSDSSQLASKRETLINPDDHFIIPDRISREPLGPVFIENDQAWLDVVTWAVFATIYAEELEVEQGNVTQLAQENDDPRVQRLLGQEGEFGAELGLENDFALQIVTQVGSYGDIYNRNLGPETPFELERGPNKAWNLGAGGVLASPPFR